MAFWALVYLRRPGSATTSYVGKTDLKARPVLNGHVSFIYEGHVVAGHIETLAPPNWAEIGVAPTIHVVPLQQQS